MKNQNGLSHHFLLPVVVLLLAGVAGFFVSTANTSRSSDLAARIVDVNSSEATQVHASMRLKRVVETVSDIGNRGCSPGYKQDSKTAFCVPTVGTLHRKCSAKAGSQWVYMKGSWKIDRQKGTAVFKCEKKSSGTSSQSQAKPDTKAYKKVQNGISKEVCASKGRVWAAGSCQRDCKKDGWVITKLPGNQIDYCYKKGDSSKANVTGQNGISYNTCMSKHRKWKDGSCSRSCATGFANITNLPGNQIDYCRAKSAVNPTQYKPRSN